MKQKVGHFEIPGSGDELSANIAKLVKDLEGKDLTVGINSFARHGELAIRPKGQTSNTSDIGCIDTIKGFVNVYDGQQGLRQFIEDYQF